MSSAAIAEVCLHPPEYVRHIGRSIYQCFGCGHTSTLVDKPYFCYKCPDVHTLTYKQMQEHKAAAHPEKRGE